MDGYTIALQQHGEERAEREVRWLEELITAERRAALDPGPAAYDNVGESRRSSTTPDNKTQPRNKE